MVSGHVDEALAIKSQTERGEDKRAEEEKAQSVSEASVLFVDVEFGNLSAIFLAAAGSSYSALTPTLLLTFCHTLSASHWHI